MPFRGHGLAGMSRLIDEEILGFQQAEVARYHISAESRTTSPGTSRSIGISENGSSERLGLRLTLAVVWTMARSWAAASFDRCSWTKAVVIARITITAITMAARTSPKK